MHSGTRPLRAVAVDVKSRRGVKLSGRSRVTTVAGSKTGFGEFEFEAAGIQICRCKLTWEDLTLAKRRPDPPASSDPMCAR